MFDRLFWFGDEFDLVDQIDRIGFWRWAWQGIRENFVPLFKAPMGRRRPGAFRVLRPDDGRRVADPRLNVVSPGPPAAHMRTPLGGRSLRPGCFRPDAANLETLAWSVQWSPGALRDVHAAGARTVCARAGQPCARRLGGGERALLFARRTYGNTSSLASAWPGGRAATALGRGPPLRAPTCCPRLSPPFSSLCLRRQPTSGTWRATGRTHPSLEPGATASILPTGS